MKRIWGYLTSESQPITGRGGAPKFFLNWLTFALLPYDADHMKGLWRVSDGALCGPLQVDDFPSVIEQKWEIFLQTRDNMRQQENGKDRRKETEK